MVKAAKLPKCAPCGRALFQDRLAAEMRAQQYNQVPQPCPSGRGWHLVNREAQ